MAGVPRAESRPAALVREHRPEEERNRSRRTGTGPSHTPVPLQSVRGDTLALTRSCHIGVEDKLRLCGVVTDVLLFPCVCVCVCAANRAGVARDGAQRDQPAGPLGAAAGAGAGQRESGGAGEGARHREPPPPAAQRRHLRPAAAGETPPDLGGRTRQSIQPLLTIYTAGELHFTL